MILSYLKKKKHQLCMKCFLKSNGRLTNGWLKYYRIGVERVLQLPWSDAIWALGRPTERQALANGLAKDQELMQSNASTVEEYMGELPEERRAAIEAVRQVILKNLPKGYEEAMNWGMITYQVPLETYPDTYNKKPLMYAALAAQKNHMAVYLTAIYMDEKTSREFETAYRATGKRYDVGKSCVRFKGLADLPLELIGESIASLQVSEFVERVNDARSV
jgi:hypothetical protein